MTKTIVIFIDSGPDDCQHPVQMSQCLSLIAAPQYRGDSLQLPRQMRNNYTARWHWGGAGTY